jgi:hypothetical protein
LAFSSGFFFVFGMKPWVEHRNPQFFLAPLAQQDYPWFLSLRICKERKASLLAEAGSAKWSPQPEGCFACF